MNPAPFQAKFIFYTVLTTCLLYHAQFACLSTRRLHRECVQSVPKMPKHSCNQSLLTTYIQSTTTRTYYLSSPNFQYAVRSP